MGTTNMLMSPEQRILNKQLILHALFYLYFYLQSQNHSIMADNVAKDLSGHLFQSVSAQ